MSKLGRPKGPKTTPITLRLPVPLEMKLKQRAARETRPLQNLILLILEESPRLQEAAK